MNRRLQFALLLIVGLVPSSGCDNGSEPARKLAQPAPPIVVFDSGRGAGPYDSMTYAKYESQLEIVPQVSISARSLIPRMWYVNGSCGYLAFIRDAQYRPLASQAGLVDGTGELIPTFSERYLDTPIELQAGVTYLIVMEVWTTKSVGILTTGARTTGIIGSADYSITYARSEAVDSIDRGAIAFQLLE